MSYNVDFLKEIEDVRHKDIDFLSSNSVINHHVNGMDYLCLRRSNELTIKIYIIPKVINHNNGFLVNPHSHRYFFGSIVLKGSLRHLRFVENDLGDDFRLFSYDCENKKMSNGKNAKIIVKSDDLVTKGQSYHVNTNEIHTLKILKPTIIGLVQERDEVDRTLIMFPNGGSRFKKSKSRPMTRWEYIQRLDMLRAELITEK